MTRDKSITLESTIQQVVGELDGPTDMDEIVQRVLAIWPTNAKKPKAAVRSGLHQSYSPTWAFLDQKTLVPLRVAMRGVRFRIPISPLDVKYGALVVDPAFKGFLWREIPLDAVRLADAAGQPLETHVQVISLKHRSKLGPYTYEVSAFALGQWFKAAHVRRGDSVLVTIEDWEIGSFRLEHEPVNRRRHEEIDRKNREWADLFWEMLEAARNENLFDTDAIVTTCARMTDPTGYPGDHWVDVIDRDPRMKWDGHSIRYAESVTPLERMLSERKPSPPPMRVWRAEDRKVYRFKVAFPFRRGLWRRIEIRDSQTLADFDGILREAFGHDDFDHMGGFWKRIRRGRGKRFRKVEVGTITPIGDGSGAEVTVASLGLAPGDELEYVYDFGDWIEHIITLEEVTELDPRASYPRIVAQNKPRYKYCEHCEARGRKEIATRICIECSDAEQREVLVCRDCLMEFHEDHYADEIIY